MNELLPLLKDGFPKKEFNLKELLLKTHYKKSKLYTLLKRLITEEVVVKIAEGTYILAEHKKIIIPREIKTLSENLKLIISRKFKFTALSILLPFAHHTLYNITYLLYVEKGSGEDFKETILKMDSTLAVLLNPTKEEVLLIMNETNKNKLLLIRENAYFYGKEYGLAYPETAFVDLYFEVSRGKIPFMKNDLKEILKELTLHNLINYSRLLRYAHERKLTKEIKNLFSKILEETDLPEGGLHVLRKISTNNRN